MDKKKRNYQAGIETQNAILAAGLDLWKTGGSRAVTASAIGAKINKTAPSVMYHFGYRIKTLRDEVAKYAVANGCTVVILQLISTEHSAIQELTAKEQTKFKAMLS